MRRGQKPEVGGRFVCQSSCKEQEGSRNPRVVVEGSRRPGRRKEQMRSGPANQRPGSCG